MLASKRAHGPASLRENSRQGVTTWRRTSHRASSRSKPRTALRKCRGVRPNGVRNRNLYGYVLNDPINFIDPSGLLNLRRGLIPGVSGGPAEAVGGVAGAVTGGVAGNALCGPACGVAGAIGGGQAGGAIGSLFDPPCGGQLNCDERLPPPPVEPIECH